MSLKSIVILAVIGLIVLFCGCTEQQIVRTWGGNATIDVEPGQKIVLVTWKDADLWFLTKEMNSEKILPRLINSTRVARMDCLREQLFLKKAGGWTRQKINLKKF